MAEEAFALSPISARASLPSEADYEAIREAFMETSRGRWFLAEYTKRNRNADTNQVLDAVSRMEATLAAQKQASSVLSLTEALAAIRAMIREAKVTSAEAMPRTDGNETLAAARDGARIIREIAWTLRECGADTRICDLLDSHIKAVEAGQQMMATGDGRRAVLASFDTLVQRIEQIAAEGAKPATARAASASTAPEPAADVAAEKREASVTPLFRSAPEHTEEAKATATPDAVEAQAAETEARGIAETAHHVDAASVIAEVSETEASETIEATLREIILGSPAENTTVETDAAMLNSSEVEDLAVLDMVAMEMGAPDLSEPETTTSDVVGVPELDAAAASEATVAPLDEEAVAAAEPEVETAQASSLGAALIANGVVANPTAPASDPLAAIRRMSQIEKIAFFS